MIDTIVIRLHDLHKYRTLITWLRRQSDKTGYTTELGFINPDETDKIESSSPQQKLKIIKFNKTGEFIAKTEVSKKMNSSHHYAFAFHINFTNDYVEFNFSIPKYKFGSNVLMFVEHSHDLGYFHPFTHHTFTHNAKRTPHLLMGFIHYFLRKEFITHEIDYKDVEINRIDVCYNQVFPSKQAAFLYLKYQKRIRKKHSRDDESTKMQWDTSFMHKSERSSSKVYHKGTEYKKHDAKEHLKINEAKGFQYFNIDKFQELADRTLRYEITIRYTELNYLFKHNIFRKDDILFKINYKDYQRIGNIKKRNKRISKNIGLLPEEKKAEYSQLHPYENISKSDREMFKYVSNLLESIPKFMLEIDEDSKIYNTKTVEDGRCFTALFDKKLIFFCLKKLYSFVKEFQLKDLPDEDIVGILIDRYNLTSPKKLAKSVMMRFYAELIKYGTFNEAAVAIKLSRASLFRYKNKFKAIGITARNIRPNGDEIIPKASIEFSEYHYYLQNNCNLLRGIKIQ